MLEDWRKSRGGGHLTELNNEVLPSVRRAKP